MNETVFTSGKPYFDYLIAAIDSARYSVDLETYIFSLDVTGKRVIQALAHAAQRGIQVRLLIDGAGSFVSWNHTTHENLVSQGVHVRIFHPFPWHPQNHGSHNPSFPDRMIHMLLNLNRRNHRKTCIIDKSIAFAGSMNISHCHVGQTPEQGWRDTAVQFSGIDLTPLIKAFEQAWSQTRFYQFSKKKEQEKPLGNRIIRLNDTWRNRKAMAKSLQSRLKHAQTKIWVTSAYFVPDHITLRRLIIAARRGVDVRILVPHTSDVFYMPWISTSFYPALVKYGVKIYEYHPKMLHAKTIVIDDWVIVGSSNLNHRSLLHDLEIDICLQKAISRQIIETQFLEDLKESHAIDKNNLYAKPWYKRAIGFVLSQFRHWI